MTTTTHGVSLNEALSGIFGSISITSWICLLVSCSLSVGGTTAPEHC